MDGQPGYLSALNPVQKEAVVHGKPPLLILAGAGSGKTRVVTTRIAWLIDHLQFQPEQILAVTFTNKAAREMSERVGRLVEGASGVMIKTFHSFCAWLLRRNAPLAGLDPYFTIYDDEDSLSLLKSLLPAHVPPTEVKAFRHWISRAKDDCLTPADDLSAISAHRDFPQVYQLYQEKLDAMGNVDFGGLIQKTVQLLQGNEAVRHRLRQRFQVLLVDEYQDSNGAQFELLRLLAGPDTWLCVVGDDDQSIYRFRGADVSHILTFEQRFPGTRIIRLEQNYRSTGHILAIASQVVSHNRGRLGKTLWTENPVGTKPVMAFLGDQDDEAAWIADKIKRAPLRETAILYRTNAQSRAFEAVFVRNRIPYRIIGTLRFYEREEIKDVLAWLTFLANPRDEIAFARIINKPARGLGKVAVDQILGHLRPGQNLVDACGLALASLKGKAKAGLDRFLTLTGEFRQALEQTTLAQLIEQVVRVSGLLDYHKAQDEQAEAGSRKVENLDELLNVAAPFSGGAEGLSQFLERITLDSTPVDEAGDTPGVVTLITMHNTKGLEFDRVFITGLEEGLFPRTDTAADPEELEEERRLFYVAITRARQELFFTSCRSRMLHGRTQDRQPSRFLEEVPEDRVQLEGGKPGPGLNYFQGMRIYHDDFGAGTIVKKHYTGEELVVEVRFDTGRMGRFLPAYQPLERIAADD